MITEELREYLQRELPDLLRQDPSFRAWLEQQIRQTAISQESFDARFDRMLQEFAADRARQDRKWDEQNRKWEEQNRKWEEDARRWEEQNRKWDEEARRWEDQNRKWDEEARRWDEQNRTNQRVLDEIERSRSRQEQGIGALGARWGLASEQSFREALKGILEKSFGVQVLNINELDDEGLVFGQPDQVEIDVIIQNGTVILCELKASMSKADIYLFERKVRFYEQRHQRPVQRKLVISPMVPPNARAVADRLGIEVFSYAEDVTA
jgi:hypothetical protein